MNLWPFPKKNGADIASSGFELPEGVKLASPDEESLSDATVPSYAQTHQGMPPVELAVAQEKPEPSPVMELTASSDNPKLDDAFNQLFSSAPSQEVPKTESTPSLELEQPSQLQPLEPSALEPGSLNTTELAQTNPISAAIPASTPQVPDASLQQLLAQLGNAAPVPSPLPMSGLTEEPIAPANAALPEFTPTTEPALDHWGLAPMEAPPLSSDWSLISSNTSVQQTSVANEDLTPFSPPDFQPDTIASQTDYPLADLGSLKAEPQSAAAAHCSSLSDILFAANPEKDNQKPSLESACDPLGSILEPTMPTIPQAEKPQPATHTDQPTDEYPSILDTLIPPPLSTMDMPSLNAPLSPSSGDMADNPTSFGNFGVIPSWDTETTSAADTATLDDFSLIPPASQQSWEEPEEFDQNPAPELNAQYDALVDPPASANHNTLSPEELNILEHLAQAGQAHHATMDTLAPPEFDTLEIDESEDSWSEDDLISESADLNSSDAAYDLNHYDDPNEPSEVIELDEESAFCASEDNLQAMANLISQLRPQASQSQPSAPKAEAAPAMPPAMPEDAYYDAAELSEFDPPLFEMEAHNIPTVSLDADLAPMPLAELVASPMAEATETEPENTPYANLADDKAAAYPQATTSKTDDTPYQTVDTDYSESDDSEAYSEFTEAGEEHMLKLKGNKSAPEVSILEALSAKFIAQPKQQLDLPDTNPVQDIPATNVVEQQPEPLQPDEPLIDPSGLVGQLPASRIKPTTLSQAMRNFEAETMLKETHFVQQSINNLVDRYFAQKEQDSSC